MKTASAFSNLSYLLRRTKVGMIFRAPPIIIGGCGRSGTTLLAAILSAHPKIYVIQDETLTFCPGAYSEHVDLNTAFDTRRFYLKYFSNYNFSFSRWCEKTPKNVLFFDRILEHFKNRVSLLHIVRDGRDVIFSRHPKDPNKYWIPPERWIDDVSSGLKHKNNPKVYTVRYEDLIMNFEETLETILNFLDLKPVPSVYDFHNHATVKETIAWSSGIQPLYRTSIGRWKNHQEENIFKDFMKNPQALNLLRELNYI